MSGTSQQASATATRWNPGWIVTFAGLGINLALGVLYTWSVVSKQIVNEWQWSETQTAWPYSLAIAVFALTTVPAGRLQDKIGPRLVATLGGILCGLGMIIAGLSQSFAGVVIGFGVLVGAGIGFGYASATPPAVKWFPKERTGLIAGLVVAGFGLASAYIAPLARYLLGQYGIQQTFTILGIAFLISIVVFAQLLRNPPAGYVPASRMPAPAAGSAGQKTDYEWGQMLRQPQFLLIWVMYMFGGGAGLMIIGKAAKIVDLQGGIQAGALFVSLLAVGNALGRVIAGVLSDKIGRSWTLFSIFVFQAVLMVALLFSNTTHLPQASLFGVLLPLLMLVGANYGANLAVFPSITKDYFGLKNFGVNYGFVFTAWGAGGLIGSLLIGRIFDTTQRFDNAYLIAAACLVVAAILTFFTHAPKTVEEEKTAAVTAS